MKNSTYLQKMFFLLMIGSACCALQACSSDDDEEIEEPTPPTPEVTKKLVKVVEEDYDHEHGDVDKDTYHFGYDNQGRIVAVTKYDDEILDETFIIEYSENSIVCTEVGDNNETVTFKLSDGKIVFGKEELDFLTYTHSYTYTSSNYLAETKGELGNHTFTWNDDKLVGGYYRVDGDNYVYSLEYDGKTCKGYNPAIVLMLASDIIYECDYFPVVVNPELAGFKTVQLPKSMNEGGEITNFTYELYDDRYLKQCMAVEEDDDGAEYKIYTFTWE